MNSEYSKATISKIKRNKRLLEKKLKVKLEIKGNKVDLQGDEIDIFVAEKVLQAVERTFPLNTALLLIEQDYVLESLNIKDITKTRKPEKGLQQLLAKKSGDVLLKAMNNLLEMVFSWSGLSKNSFGVFGSLLHGFYHPNFSDLDFTIYGRDNLNRLCDTLEELYKEDTGLRNEFDNIQAVSGKDWQFKNYSLKEYLWHQRRKMIYAYFESKSAKRIVKVEFEPIKVWKEITNEYSPFTRISHVGWIKAIVEINEDKDAPFIPSIYKINVKNVLEGPKVDDITRIFSYLEEFRMQAKKGEQVQVEGNLEKVVNGTNIFHQITLSYGSRYYEQTLKVIKPI